MAKPYFTRVALRSKATFSILFSLLSFIWKRQFERREKSEKNKKTRQSSFKYCRFFLAESVGFEPTVPFGITSFQDWLLKPLGQLSMYAKLYHFAPQKSM